MIWELLLAVFIILLALGDLYWMKRQDRLEKEKQKERQKEED